MVEPDLPRDVQRVRFGTTDPPIAMPAREKWPAGMEFLIGIAVHDGQVLMSFTEPVRWMLMPAPKAMDVARQIVVTAEPMYRTDSGLLVPPSLAKAVQR